MKKFLTILVITGLLSVALFPFFVFAQSPSIDDQTIDQESPQCCKLKHKIKWGNLECGPGITTCGWVGTVGETPGECADCTGAGTGADACKPDPNWAGYCVVDAIASVGDIVKYAAMIAVGVALLIAAVMFVVSAGNPERVGMARKIFYYSFIGVIIATLAHFLPGVVRFFLGI